MGKNYRSAIVWANGKQNSRPKTGKKFEHEFIFRLEHSVRENRTTFLDVPLLSRLPLDIDGTLLLFNTIFRYSNCFLSSVATSGKDGHGLKIEKVRPTFPSFNIVPSKINKNIIMVGVPLWNLIDIQFFILPGTRLRIGGKGKNNGVSRAVDWGE